MKIFSTILFAFLISLFCSSSAFGHGLGGEVSPPVKIENKDASLSISISPSIYDPVESEKYISLRLFDANTDAIIEHVTFEFELQKDGEQIFKEIFHDELGDLSIKVITENSDIVTIEGEIEPILGGWMTNDSSLVMRGPIFISGGLYDYNVKILSIDSDSNVLSDEVQLQGAISLAETKSFQVLDSQNNEQTIRVISYFDKLDSFNFDSNKVTIFMPFDWNQDLEQLSVVHQEIRVPNTFGDFLFTTYQAVVNDIPLPDDTVNIDDYSFEDRTIHIVLNQELLKQIRNNASKYSDDMIIFELQPSDKVKFPLEFTTPDLRYKVFLSWEPEVIKSGKEVIFFLSLEELFSDKTKKIVEYDLSIVQDNSEIFSKHLVGNVNSESPNSHKIQFNENQVGTANFVLSNIDGNSLSKGNFILVIHPSEPRIESVPAWIKNNAGWWAEGAIDDDAFVQGIQFLIKENVLLIPTTSAGGSTGSNEIPEWIKNNAGWWAEGAIDDDAFVQGIQFLIKEGIIQIQN